MTTKEAIKIIKEDALYNPECAKMSIEALEYREPKKVIGEKNHIKQCPRCGHDCGIRWNGDYCNNCGQRLDWGDYE